MGDENLKGRLIYETTEYLEHEWPRAVRVIPAAYEIPNGYREIELTKMMQPTELTIGPRISIEYARELANRIWDACGDFPPAQRRGAGWIALAEMKTELDHQA